MNKIFSTSLIVLGIGLFCATPVFANGLVVEFEETPLFNEANFLPGESIARWVRVTNNSGETQRIAAEAINVNNSDGLGYALVLEITEDSQSYYINDLSKFFNAGEVYLSDLANGSSTTYNFSIDFYPGTGNTFQGKSLGFDILIGFQGEGGGLPPGSGGGGGGFLPPGLTIREPVKVIPETTSATITWVTNYFSTSQVVYAAENDDYEFDLTEINYGYPHAFPDPEDSTKVTAHSVTISGLISGTTYYFRCVSHGSFAVSTEHSFTTLSVIGEEEPAQISEKIEAGREEIVIEGETEEGVGEEEEKEEPSPITGEEEEEEEPAQISEEIEAGKEEEEIVEGEEGETGLGWLLATIGNIFDSINLCLILFILIIILIVLSLLSIEEKNKDDKKKKKWWISNFIILILIILYYFICPFSLYCWLIILGLVVLIVLLSLFKNRKKREK